MGAGDTIRGLDDALVGGQTLLAAANHDGSVQLLDSAGKARWSYTYPGLLRRLRSYDLNGDGNSELLLGGEANRLVMLDAASGKVKLDKPLGQVITEIRDAELDGKPESREFLVGGKKGGVWAFRADGSELWSATLPGKINEFAQLGTGAGSQVVVGDDNGNLAVLLPAAEPSPVFRHARRASRGW